MIAEIVEKQIKKVRPKLIFNINLCENQIMFKNNRFVMETTPISLLSIRFTVELEPDCLVKN
jgi:hypothetical protein